MTTKTATVLMSDLASSTELAVKIGDSTAAAVFRAHLATVRGLVEHHGGTLVKLMGDGALAWFDSTSAAIECAAAIQRSALREDRRLPSALKVRVGLSVGEVLLSADDGDIYGSAVVEAARLCSISEPGGILATDVVVALAGSRQQFPTRRLDAVHLKGFNTAVTPVEIRWQTGDLPQALPRSLERANRRGPCVGRDAALDSLQAALDGVQLGDDRVVLVVGEAGIGKSRLAAAFAERVVSRGAPVAYGWCDPQFQSPYQPWVEALGSLTAALTPEQLRAIDPADDLARLLPGLPAPAAGPEASFNAGAVRQRLFDAVGGLIAAGGAPAAVLVLDDAQWIDPASVSLLRSLLRSGRTRHLLVVICTRPTGLTPGHPLNDFVVELRRTGELDRIDLSGLDADALAAIVEQVTGGVSSDLVESLQRLTDGNPFLVGQLLEHPQIRESLTISVVPSTVLAGVRQLVEDSLGALEPLELQAVRLAAVHGRDVDLGTLAAFAATDLGTTADALDRAVQIGLLVEHADASVGFKHQIIRDAVYDQLSSARRAELHWTIGTALAGLANSEPSMVAHHLCAGVAAGDTATAVVAALTATDAAATRSAFEVAHAFARQAEQLVRSRLPDRADLLARSLVAQAETGRVILDASTDVTATLVEASEIAHRMGLTDIMHRAAVAFTGQATFGQVDPELLVVAQRALDVLGPDDPARAGVLATVGTARFLRGDVAGGERDIDASIEVAERTGSDEARYLAYNARSALGQQRPDVSRFGADVVAALDAAGAIGGAPWLTITRIRLAMYCIRIGNRVRLELENRTFLADTSAQDYAVFARILAGSLAMADGRWSEPEATARALAAQIPASSPFHDIVLAHLAAALAGQERYAEASSVLERIPERLEALALTLRARRAFLSASQGRMSEARELLDSVLGAADTPAFEYYQGSVLFDLAHNILLTGADEHVANVIARLESYAGQILLGGGVLAIWGPADDLRSRLLARQGDLDSAILAARSAATVAQRFGASVFIVRTQHHLADLLLRHGDPADRDIAVGLLRDALRHTATHERPAKRIAVETLLRSVT